MELPDSVKSVGDRAFYGCSGLQYVDLNGDSEVGKDAFYSPYGASAMEFAVFGGGPQVAGARAFGNCSRISELEVHCGLFPSFEGAFTDVDVRHIHLRLGRRDRVLVGLRRRADRRAGRREGRLPAPLDGGRHGRLLRRPGRGGVLQEVEGVSPDGGSAKGLPPVQTAGPPACPRRQRLMPSYVERASS
ncbi:MAG: leucine-rich repeat protein [Candidatus Methanomethylophilaceae archaeon]|nr:leucine-rich repeat protein [Candidatus Methanomethylophilaceae archaeon]